jgi:hypothetical protein
VAEQNDVTKLYEEFEEVFVDVLTAKSKGLSFSRRMKLRLARSRAPPQQVEKRSLRGWRGAS